MLRPCFRAAVLLFILGVGALAGCGSDNSSNAGDTIRPAAIADLAARTTGPTTVALTWTAVGEDSLTGTASVYDVRYTTNLTPRWDAMNRTSGEPAPKEAGQPETFTVTALEANKTYRFIVKSADKAENPSAESNVAVATTLASDADLGWWPGFAPYPDGAGMDGAIDVLAPFGLDLVAGGNFTRAGGVQVGNIAAWNGSAWRSLGAGVDGSVVALVPYREGLAAGGTFTQAGGGRATYLAFWDGATWNGPDIDLDGPVSALTVFDGDLIVGGGFRRAGADTVNYIARFDGERFHPLGEGTDDWVRALAVHDGMLVAGGYFTHAGGDSAVYVAAWDGTTWQPLGLGAAEPPQALAGVLSLVEHDGSLFAGGTFHSLGGSAAVFLGRWDAATWVSFDEISGGSFTDPGVYAMASRGGSLYLTGRFQSVGGVVCNHVAAWDGSSFRPLGIGVGGQGYRAGLTLAEYGGSLYLGGMFNAVGNRPAAGIARWDD
jgi:hypothetical protein